MTYIRFSAFLFLLPGALWSQTFADFLVRVNGAAIGERTAIVDSFMNAVESFPFIEFDTLAHAIYRGTANQVALAGDANGWSTTANLLENIEGTNFWHFTADFESDARLDYKFVTNGSNWILDPLNPFTCMGGFGPNSELRMPDYVPPPEINYYPDIAHGTLRDTTFFSAALGNSRQIRIYTPPGYDTSTDDYPLVVVHDGLEYISLARMDRVLDFLIYQGRIEPTIAVFIPPVNRTEEYRGNLQDEFGQFISEEVLPWVDAAYRTRTDPAQRAVLGASDGGNISLWLAVTYPEQFGKAAGMSSNVETNILDRLEQDPQLNLEFYLDMGTYDISILIPRMAALREVLDERGYEYEYHEWHEGHSWGNWRAHIDLALVQFFPGEVAVDPVAAPMPLRVALMQNYPNPFNPTTEIKFDLPERVPVQLIIYNILGQQVVTLVDEIRNAGTLTIPWDGKNSHGIDAATGMYIYQIKAGNFTDAKKMVLMR